MSGIRPIELQLSLNKPHNSRGPENQDKVLAEQISNFAHKVEKNVQHSLSSTPNTYKSENNSKERRRENHQGRRRKCKSKKKNPKDANYDGTNLLDVTI